MSTNRTLNHLHTILESGNNAEILKTIERLRSDGSATSIPYLVDVLVNNPSEDVKNAVAAYLFDLKEKSALPALIRAIQDPRNREYQQLLVSACWESGLDCTPYLDFFIDLAIIADYMVCLECLTVIENMPGPFDPATLDMTISKIKNAADEDNEGKFDLLNSLWEVLVDFRHPEITNNDDFTFNKN